MFFEFLPVSAAAKQPEEEKPAEKPAKYGGTLLAHELLRGSEYELA